MALVVIILVLAIAVVYLKLLSKGAAGEFAVKLVLKF